jgi:replication factor A1
MSSVGAEMKTEEAIGQIRAACPWISRDQILKRLEKEKRKTGGFISDETLLSMIAAEFGCAISKRETPVPSLSLADLIPGLNDVTAVGRVLATFPSKTFEGNRKGKFASLLIDDRSAILRVVLWNDKASLLESGIIKVGELVRFSHGYTRENLSGKVELHVGDKCKVEADPQGLEKRDYPGIGKFSTRIGELTGSHVNKRVNLVGTVKRMFPASSFKRRDSSQGTVMRFVLGDHTGEVSVVVWNEKVGELEKTVVVGAKLKIVNARVKKAPGEGLEVHVDAVTYAGSLAQDEETLRIADLKEGQGGFTVEGEVATKPMLRDVKTGSGELLKLATFEIKDETGRIWVSAWREHADAASNLRLGDKIIIKDAYAKKGFSDQLEISTRGHTSITIAQ